MADSQGAVSANRVELLQIADALAREKDIDPHIVMEAIAEAIEKAARFRYGAESHIHVDVDEKTGVISLSRLKEVVEEVEDTATQINLKDAQKLHDGAVLGDKIAEDLPPIEFGRVAALTARQVITHKVHEAERARQYEEYKDRIGEVVNGIVRRMEYGNVIVDLGRAEALVPRRELLPREVFRSGDRIRAYIYDVRQDTRGPQIFLSRAHREFMVRLFAQEVPEIYDGIIEVKAVARDPGSRAKIAVLSHDSAIDPVGACVGMRGSRVQAVVNELQGEKIDIIRYSPSQADFIVKALEPAQVVKVILDEDNKRVETVVPDDFLSLAIGRHGQNVRLASQLTGWTIDILTEAEESERRQKEFLERTQLFMKTLDVDETIAQLLAAENFTSLEDVALVESSEIAEIDGLDAEMAETLQTRARAHIAAEEAAWEEERKKLGVADTLKEMPGLSVKALVLLGKNNVKTLENLADLARDDLSGWYEMVEGTRTRREGILDDVGMSAREADTLILEARLRLGWIDPPEEPADEESDPEDSEDSENSENSEEESSAEEDSAEDKTAEDETAEDKTPEDAASSAVSKEE